MSEWGDWSACSADCTITVGTRERKRVCFEVTCDGFELLDTEDCEYECSDSKIWNGESNIAKIKALTAKKGNPISKLFDGKPDTAWWSLPCDQFGCQVHVSFKVRAGNKYHNPKIANYPKSNDYPKDLLID